MAQKVATHSTCGKIASMTHFGCIPLGWSGSGSVNWDHSVHGRSNEPMNPCAEWIHRLFDLPWFQCSQVTDPDPDLPR